MPTERGQILLVTHGRGLAINESGDGGSCCPVTSSGLRRASATGMAPATDTYLTHTAISLGGTDWQQAVTDEQYADASATHQTSS